MRILKSGMAIMLGFITISVGAYAQSSNTAWLESLTQQLAKEMACEVTYYILVNEKKVRGLWAYSARAQCVDGRQFDASKNEAQAEFVIEKCKVTVCLGNIQQLQQNPS